MDNGVAELKRGKSASTLRPCVGLGILLKKKAVSIGIETRDLGLLRKLVWA
jgi:hypothetical protein